MLNLQFSDYSTDGTQNTPEGLLWFIKYIHLLSDTRWETFNRTNQPHGFMLNTEEVKW